MIKKIIYFWVLPFTLTLMILTPILFVNNFDDSWNYRQVEHIPKKIITSSDHNFIDYDNSPAINDDFDDIDLLNDLEVEP